MEAASGGDSGAGGGEAPSAAPAPSPAPAAAPPTALAPGQTPAPAPAAPAKVALTPDPHAWLPQKLRVMNGEALDLDASARKAAEAYQQLERRLGSGGTPPSSPGEYTLDGLGDELKAQIKPEDPLFQGFLTDVHKVGLTQPQLDVVLKHHANAVNGVMAAKQEFDHDACMAELNKVWPDSAESIKQRTGADRALKAFAGERYADLAERYGNDPNIVWLLANIGHELKEDTAPQERTSAAPSGGVEQLLGHPAYNDPKHPQHKEISAKVREHFARNPK